MAGDIKTDRRENGNGIGRRWYDSLVLRTIGGLLMLLSGLAAGWAIHAENELDEQRDAIHRQGGEVSVLRNEITHIKDDLGDIKTEQRAMHEDVKRLLQR